MFSFQQQFDIPADRKLIIELPADAPVGAKVAVAITTQEPASASGEFPAQIISEEDRVRYRRIVASLPSEEDLSLIATVPTAEWTAKTEQHKQ